tara:strand:+ start:2159 stop:2341 length:183 start_codon:yes stop_codon:yes gene_type:complete
MAKNVKLISGGIAAAAAIAAATYIGTKVYKQMKDLNFDDIFEDMNESFFSSWPNPEKNNE